MSPLSEDEFLDKILADTGASIFCCNFLSGYFQGLLSAESVKSFFDWWRNSLPYFASFSSGGGMMNPVTDTLGWLGVPLGRWKELYRTLPDLADLGDKPEFRLLCKKIARNVKNANLSSVVNAQDFINYMASLDREAVFGELLLDTTTEGSRLRMSTAGGNSYLASTSALKNDSTLGDPGGVFWYTKAKNIEHLLTIGDKADMVRDFLGLVHIPDNVELLALEFNHLDAPSHYRPTAIDAGLNPRFKAPLCSSRSKSLSAWGHTLDLSKFAVDAKLADGGPERVSEALPASAINLVNIHALGRTLLKRGGSRVDHDEAYDSRLKEHMSITSIKEEIITVIS